MSRPLRSPKIECVFPSSCLPNAAFHFIFTCPAQAHSPSSFPTCRVLFRHLVFTPSSSLPSIFRRFLFLRLLIFDQAIAREESSPTPRSLTTSTIHATQVDIGIDARHLAHDVTDPFVSLLLPPLSIVDTNLRDHTSSGDGSQRPSFHAYPERRYGQLSTHSAASTTNITSTLSASSITATSLAWAVWEDGVACFWQVATAAGLFYLTRRLLNAPREQLSHAALTDHTSIASSWATSPASPAAPTSMQEARTSDSRGDTHDLRGKVYRWYLWAYQQRP